MHRTLTVSVLFQDAADAAKSSMVSIIGLDSDKVQKLCDAANEEVDEANKVQIANFLCPVSFSKSYVGRTNSIFTLHLGILHLAKHFPVLLLLIGKLCGLWRC